MLEKLNKLNLKEKEIKNKLNLKENIDFEKFTKELDKLDEPVENYDL